MASKQGTALVPMGRRESSLGLPGKARVRAGACDRAELTLCEGTSRGPDRCPTEAYTQAAAALRPAAKGARFAAGDAFPHVVEQAPPGVTVLAPQALTPAPLAPSDRARQASKVGSTGPSLLPDKSWCLRRQLEHLLTGMFQ